MLRDEGYAADKTRGSRFYDDHARAVGAGQGCGDGAAGPMLRTSKIIPIAVFIFPSPIGIAGIFVQPPAAQIASTMMAIPWPYQQRQLMLSITQSLSQFIVR
jgi:hypothetical protein